VLVLATGRAGRRAARRWYPRIGWMGKERCQTGAGALISRDASMLRGSFDDGKANKAVQ